MARRQELQQVQPLRQEEAAAADIAEQVLQLAQVERDSLALDYLAQGLRLLLNEAMQIERSQVLQAAPYERTEARQGYANGYKDKTLLSRLGPLALRVPQVRGGVDFYPSVLERGVRSEP